MWFSWVGAKRDGRNKIHFWGVLVHDHDHITEKYIVWGPASGPMHKRPVSKLEYLFAKKEQKIRNGYRAITQEYIEKKFPEFLTEIEMIFMMEKLKNGT